MAVRVHELAKEFGVPSKVILSTLSDMGEYVKSASSTVEAPVIRRLKEEGEKHAGRPFSGAVIGRPVRFVDNPILDAQAEEAVRRGAI